MKATIWHNPNCSTSRKTLDILREAGAEVEVVEYLKTPPSRDTLARLYRVARMRPVDGLRMREDGASDVPHDDDAVLDAMIANPRLIQRPLVETERGVVLARPQDKVREIL
jgi:arsenate reductase (glutaredoxin)